MIKIELMRRTILLLFLVFTAGIATFGQDGRYWSESYGNQSVLLNGSVNGGVSDIGAVFYNPARLSWLKTNAFVVSARVYELSIVTVEDGITDNKDLKVKNFGNAPSLVAGSFTLPFLKDHHFAVSFLTRQKTQADFTVSAQKEGDLIDQTPGEELVRTDENFKIGFREEWLGLSWSYAFSEKFGIGISNFFSYINKGSLTELDINSLDENNRLASLQLNRSLRYRSAGVLWKLGSTLDLGGITMGLTVTTPRVKFSGQGSASIGDYLVNVDQTGNGEPDDVFISYAEQGMKVKYRTPWAIGFGVGIPFKKGVFHLSTEWYDKVPRYTLMETNPFVGQSTGETSTFALVDELNQVWNVGVGLEWQLKSNLGIYLSYATDFSGVTSDITRLSEFQSEAANSVFQSDFYKIGGGFLLKAKKLELTLGIIYTRGDQDIARLNNFPGEDPILDNGDTSNIGFDQWRMILGFSIPYGTGRNKDVPSTE